MVDHPETMMLECMKLAVPVCLATHDKDATSVVKMATAFYNAIVASGTSQSDSTPTPKPKR
jgi:hypothetical protein